MNVIIANKYKDMLMNLDIEVIKSIEGEFDVDSLINTFSNFYYDRMILDITAIKDYQDFDNLQKLSINFDMSKIILLLDDSEESSTKSYLSKLISVGIYNFTRNIDGIKYLLDNPNTYRDVAHLHMVNETPISEEGISNLTRVIGVKSLTEGAGATTLVYLMKKHLENNYSVCALEVDRRDFSYFDSKGMESISGVNLAKELMKKREYNVVLVDLNEFNDPEVCNEVLYLLEPSIIKLNKLLMKDRHVFEKVKDGKIVLVKSHINDKDLTEFEYETKCKVFYNLPSIDERKEVSKDINGLLNKLGFIKQTDGVNSDDDKGKLLGMFKF